MTQEPLEISLNVNKELRMVNSALHMLRVLKPEPDSVQWYNWTKTKDELSGKRKELLDYRDAKLMGGMTDAK